jgi:hypothetical protein
MKEVATIANPMPNAAGIFPLRAVKVAQHFQTENKSTDATI